ncbi:MAG: hypothetical protein ACYCU0_02695 [Solirubrobacteraceae bacterium]
MVRRRVAGGVAVVIVIVLVLAIDAAVKGGASSALQEYRRQVDALGEESQHGVAKSFFGALEGATGRQQIQTSNKLNAARTKAEAIAQRAEGLSVPSSAAEAQRDLVLALRLRSEGVQKVAGLMESAASGKLEGSSGEIAGDMQNFLASDVIWSQRVIPLADEALKQAGVGGAKVEDSRFLPNLGWLESSTALSRIGGKASAEGGALAPGTHGDALTGVSVGGTTLEAEPAVNHISEGANPTFTVAVQDSGESTETGVKVQVIVTAGGKSVSASHTINKIEAGKTLNVPIAVTGVKTGVEAKVEAKIEKVPGEENLENNQATYLAIFE